MRGREQCPGPIATSSRTISPFSFWFSICSVLVPTKPRLCDSSDSTILQQLQPQRSNLVHERRQLSLQFHHIGGFLLHQRRTGPLPTEPEAAHFFSVGQWLCLLSLRRSQCIGCFRSFLSHRLRQHPGSAYFCTAFFCTVAKVSDFRSSGCWIWGVCITQW